MKKKNKYLNIIYLSLLCLTVVIILYGAVRYVLISTGVITVEPRGKYIYYYNGYEYEPIINWFPTGDITKQDKAWFGYSKYFPESGKVKGNKKIDLYDNDSNSLFFHYKTWYSSGDELYHRKDDILPKPYDDNAEIVFEFTDRSPIIIEGELEKLFKEFIEKCLTDTETILKEKPTIGLASIKVYYNDYPAYNYFGSISLSNSDNVLMAPINMSGVNNIDGNFVLPDILSEQIKQLIKD